jgi:2-polyprenyl-6-hydroxyphenyl methylase/3-demethylubiquinone-9 3-methyltransferase
MIKKTSKIQEYKKFKKIALEWWKPKGKFKILHEILPIRIEYIKSNIKKKSIENLNILDLGCGGGLTCEPLAKLKAKVTGVDFIKENIEVAKNHAKLSNLEINYMIQDLDKINIKTKYDVILILEVIEHLDDWEKLILNIKKNLKPKGKIIISTINKNYLSKIFAIYVAENILKWIPKNTHDYQKLVNPKNLKEFLMKNGFAIENVTGMNFNPLANKWKLSKKNFSINYFCTATLN